MPRPTLLTDRIELRAMTREHLPLLAELDADPEVLRFILGRARTVQEVHQFWGPICADQQADAVGLGWWVGFARERSSGVDRTAARDNDSARSGGFLGWWDLSPRLPLDDPGQPPRRAELGYRLARRHWRQGLATEGARGLLAHGFETVGLRAVWADTMAVNAGSRGVMRRLGLTHVSTEVRGWSHPVPGSDHGEVVYEISHREWLEGRRQRSLPIANVASLRDGAR